MDLRNLPPRFRLRLLPDEERETARHIEALLSRVHSHVEGFANCLGLFDFAEGESYRLSLSRSQRAPGEDCEHDRSEYLRNKHLMAGWTGIAGREAIMQLYHFRNLLKNTQALTGKAPTLLAKIDRRTAKRAGFLFDELFPNHYALRCAIAHSGEENSTPAEESANALPQGGTLIVGCWTGRTFQNTIKGKIHSFELSHAALANLGGIRDVYFSAFSGC